MLINLKTVLHHQLAPEIAWVKNSVPISALTITESLINPIPAIASDNQNGIKPPFISQTTPPSLVTMELQKTLT